MESLAIVGVSGAGKTALMAKLAHLSYEKMEMSLYYFDFAALVVEATLVLN